MCVFTKKFQIFILGSAMRISLISFKSSNKKGAYNTHMWHMWDFGSHACQWKKDFHTTTHETVLFFPGCLERKTLWCVVLLQTCSIHASTNMSPHPSGRYVYPTHHYSASQMSSTFCCLYDTMGQSWISACGFFLTIEWREVVLLLKHSSRPTQCWD